MKDDDLISKEDLIQNLVVDDYMEDYSLYPDYGIFHLTICQAARLFVVDLWYSGSYFQDVNEPEGFDGETNNENVIAILSDLIETFEGWLIASLEKGHIKAKQIRRNFDDTIVPSLTFLEYDTLLEWLDERGFDTGEHVADWLEKEVNIATRIAEEVAFVRAIEEGEITGMHIYGAGALLDGEDLIVDEESRKLAIKHLVLENKKLRKNISDLKSNTTPHDKKLTTRSRKTHQILITALCKKAGIELGARGAAGKIMKLTEEIGIPVSDDTIATILDEIKNMLNDN